MWVYDLETLAFLNVNHTAIDKYGYSRDEFLRMTIKDIRPQEDIPKLLEKVNHIREGYDEAGTWRHRKKDGTVIDVEIISHSMMYEGKRAEIVLAHDITERKQAEEELKKSEDKFRELFDNAPIGYHELDARGMVTNVNST